jgi:hypothetical protein
MATSAVTEREDDGSVTEILSLWVQYPIHSERWTPRAAWP